MFSHTCNYEKDWQEKVGWAGLKYPGGADQGLHEGEPGVKAGEHGSLCR